MTNTIDPPLGIHLYGWKQRLWEWQQHYIERPHAWRDDAMDVAKMAQEAADASRLIETNDYFEAQRSQTWRWMELARTLWALADPTRFDDAGYQRAIYRRVSMNLRNLRKFYDFNTDTTDQ